MPGIPRLMVTNRVQASATVLTASSAGTGTPVSWLKDQLRSKTWRSAIGWTIVTGENDRIDFNRGGVKVATIAAGTYTTGAALAAAIVTALEAADATPVWQCAYGAAGTGLFSFGSDIAFTLLFATGSNLTRSVHIDLGFPTTNTSSATYHPGTTAVYQSRQAIYADLGSALSAQAGILINHNSGTGGTYKLQGNATTLVAVGYGAAPTIDSAMTGDANVRVVFLGSPVTLRYWRLLINNCESSLGYSEVGIWFAGPYTQPTVTYSIGFEKRWEELSGLAATPSGAHWQDERPRRPVWGISWLEVGEADRASLAAAFALVPRGKCFFLSFDAVTTPTSTEYGFIVDGVSEVLTSGLYYNVPVPSFAGALG